MLRTDTRTDAQLMAAFVGGRDQEAFESLVGRHEALVLSVCTRILRDEHGARDAAQAVFLVLARKGASLDLDRPLGPWLHRVACGLAISARREREARRRRELRAMDPTAGGRPPGIDPEGALRDLLDGELDGLPERYRRPLILFHVEGKSLEETARELGSPTGTVGAWLSRGRGLLRDRLVRRGAGAVSGAVAVAALAREAGAQGVGRTFARAVARAAAGGALPESVAFIMKGAMTMSLIVKLKTAALVLVATGVFLAASSVLSRRAPAASDALLGTSRLQAALTLPGTVTLELPHSSLTFEPFERAESPFPPTSDLVGHWKLDDEKGSTTAADALGKAPGKVVGAAQFSDGKLGGALKCDGSGGHVEIANTDELDGLQAANYSVAAWFRPDAVPAGTEAANTANFGIVMKTGWHEGLYYTNEKKFTMCHWLATEKPEEPLWVGTGAWDEDYEPGQWYHLVGTVDRTAGKITIYLNGEAKNSAEFPANAPARPYGTTTWKIGVANPGAQQYAWPARGSIDDVRLYGRVLAASEVKSLYEGK